MSPTLYMLTSVLCSGHGARHAPDRHFSPGYRHHVAHDTRLVNDAGAPFGMRLTELHQSGTVLAIKQNAFGLDDQVLLSRAPSSSPQVNRRFLRQC